MSFQLLYGNLIPAAFVDLGRSLLARFLVNVAQHHLGAFLAKRRAAAAPKPVKSPSTPLATPEINKPFHVPDIRSEQRLISNHELFVLSFLQGAHHTGHLQPIHE